MKNPTVTKSTVYSPSEIEDKIKYLYDLFTRSGVGLFGDQFKVIDQMKPLTKLLFARLMKHPHYAEIKDYKGRAFSIKRGIGACGDVRIGKTWTMKAYHRMVSGTISRNYILNAESLEKEVSISGPQTILDLVEVLRRENAALIIDDLAEEGKARYMGKEVDAIPFMLKQMDYRGLFTPIFATSNKAPERIEARYDKRAFARLRQRCDFVKLDGKNLTD